ncbi:MAG TPA: lysophospholipid acyltransferase family protein [Myxococcales bacterium]|jgi:1-acyl-sn-glycerol-3-phosphate acyltransferase|nr:lysophospholipid acyltransferase family protein [Myxococcales bacterium]
MSTALVRYDGDKPRGVFGRLRGAMQKWALSQGGPELEARLARLVAPQNEYGVDPFGLELDFAKAAIAPVLWLYRNYFRVETHGIEQVPQGRVMLISNHSGQLPLDGAMIAMSLLLEAEPPRVVRAMVEKWAPTLPFVAPFFARIGQVVGTPENCRRLLAAGETIMVFPEGTRGLNKTYDKRYRLQEFGSGFMRIAVETQTPVLPVAVIGAEEQAPALFDFKQVAKIFGFPALPITPTLVPLPLPVKYRLWFGEPMRFSGTAHDDDAELERKVSEVKRAIETLLKRGLKSRGSIFR